MVNDLPGGGPAHSATRSAEPTTASSAKAGQVIDCFLPAGASTLVSAAQ